jgi:hypothetical protein
MTDHRRARGAHLPAAAIGLAFLLAACGGEPASSGCPAEAPSPAPTPPFAHDPELADRIPDEVGGQPLEIQTVCATIADPGGLPTTPQMLEAVGVELSDVTVAVTPNVGQGENRVAVTAWRYAGAEEAAIREAFLGLLDETGIPVEEDTIGGTPIHRAVFHVYHVAGDTLYAVLAEDAEVEEVLAGLP